MKKLTIKEYIYFSLMVFGIFFGAGNLIFPVFLGKQAGSNSLEALISFGLSGVLLSMSGVVVGLKTNGYKELLDRVDNKFYIIYTTAISLAIGPGVAIPRAGSIPFEIGITPYLYSLSFDNNKIVILRFLYTLIFFIIVYYFAIKPNEIIYKLSKIITPILIILIIVLFLGVVFKGSNEILKPSENYLTHPMIEGFLQGYNTMDALGSSLIAIILITVLNENGIKDKKNMVKSGVIIVSVAGILMFLIYSLLTYIGVFTSYIFPDTQNGAQILPLVAKYIYGDIGYLLITLIFSIACFSVCVGLISSISKYFSETFKILTYRKVAFISTFLSFVIANYGLNSILSITVPILLAIYPVTLVIVCLGIFEGYIKNNLILKLTLYTVTIFNIFLVFFSNKIEFLNKLALQKYNMAWLIPTIIVFSLSYIFLNKKEQG